MYGNITRNDIKQFLQNQPNYQLTKQMNIKLKRPITAQYPNQLWCIDLIDFNEYKAINRNYRYKFNCIDVFSRKCWLRKIKHKTPDETKNALQDIIHNADILPKSNLTGLGTEFEGSFKQYYNKIGITLIHTQSHSPSQNAIIERANKDVRKILNYLFKI